MSERYEFPVASWAGVFGSTMSEEELQDLWEEVRRERALWFWEWECPRGLWFGVDDDGDYYWMTCGGVVFKGQQS